jgi:TonB family protein
MNRLQKKCLIAAAGTHLLLVVLLLCSGFIQSKPKPDDSQVLDVIPAKLIDAAFNSGVKGAQPPLLTPVVKPPEPQPQPVPEPPQPVVKPVVEPVKAVEPVKPPEKIQPEDLKPVENSETKPKPPKHEVKPDLTKVVRSKPTVADTSAADAAKEAKRMRDARIRAIQNAARTIKENASSSTSVEMPPGNSTVAYANYASIVKSVYTQAWIPPDDTASDDANVKVSVTIANDGRVISAHIVTPSGDASVDQSVQKTLDRVTDIAPFPDGATDKERTYIINFNLKAKRMLG